MVNVTVPRVSALAGHYKVGRHGSPESGVVITEVPDLELWQLAAWPETLSSAAEKLASACGVDSVPVSYTHLRAHETDSYLVCRLLLEKKK